MANPEPGAEEKHVGPPKTAEEQAVDMVSEMLAQEDQPPQPTKEEPEEPTSPDEPEESEEKAEAEETDETTSEEEAEEESQEEEEESLPDAIEDFAAAYEMTPEDFLAHVKVTRTVNGQKQQITLSEALRDHQFEADYRQKTSQLADDKRSFESERQQAQERLQQDYQNAAQLVQILESRLQPNGEDLVSLLDPNSPNYNPEQYHLRKAQVDQDREAINAAKHELQRQWHERQAEQGQRIEAYRREQQRLLAEAIPEAGDPEKAPVFERNLAKFLTTEGYSDEEVRQYFQGAWDHRQIKIAKKAMLYDSLEQGKKKLVKTVKKKPPLMAKSGPSKGPQSEADKTAATRERLRRSKNKSAKHQEEAALDYIRRIV